MKDKRGTEATSGQDEEIDLDPETAALFRSIHDKLGTMDLFTLLDVDLNASATVLRRSYFKRSRIFHPDRYFSRKLGPYKKMLERIFAWMAASYDFLKDDRHRAAYRKKILTDRDGGSGLGGSLIAVETAGGLEFRITDDKAFFSAEQTPAQPAVGGEALRQVTLPQKRYALPRLRSRPASAEAPAPGAGTGSESVPAECTPPEADVSEGELDFSIDVDLDN